MDRENESIQNGPWRDYFLNESGNYILQGLVLDEIMAAGPILGKDVSNLDIAQSGREGLEAIHKQGVLHGDVKNILNAMLLRVPKARIIWIDFSMAHIGGASFVKDASQEILLWDSYFRS
jgi:tRNA A-37 threonylcarbamoyl transferase component Bud32